MIIETALTYHYAQDRYSLSIFRICKSAKMCNYNFKKYFNNISIRYNSFYTQSTLIYRLIKCGLVYPKFLFCQGKNSMR